MTQKNVNKGRKRICEMVKLKGVLKMLGFACIK